MKIVSINIAVPTNIQFNNENVSTGIYKQPVTGPVAINSTGIEGDSIIDTAVHGGLDQAVYLYHQEDYDWWSEQLGKSVEPGAFGENLTIAGAKDIDWVIGDRININGVELEITAPRVPCFKLGVKMGDSKIVKQFVQAVRPGAYVRVITPGTVAIGDELRVTKTEQDYATVKDVFKEWHSKKKSLETIKKALASPIGRVHKAVLQDWHDSMK